MSLYILIAFLFFLAAVFEYAVPKIKKSVLWVIILLTPLFILSAFRAPSVGNDSLTYYNSYFIVINEDLFSKSVSSMEIGYVILSRLFGLIGFEYIHLQVLITCFIFIVLAVSIYKYSKNVAFSVYIFITSRMFFDIMNISRQYISIAILMLSVSYIKEKKFIKFFLLVLLASLFHISALVFLISYPISNITYKKGNVTLILLIGIVASVMFDEIVRMFTNLNPKYLVYLHSEYFNSQGNIAIYFNLLIYLSIFFAALITGYRKYVYRDNNTILANHYMDEQKIWFSFCLIAVICGLAGLNAPLVSRISIYFTAFYIFAIPNIVSGLKGKVEKLVLFSVISIGFFLNYYITMLYRPEWNRVYPYLWYWNW
ncbi:EpsG family protein [Paenibacillus sp. CAU 1782]